MSKHFGGIQYNGSITEYRDTLSDGSPEHYHVTYTDGDAEDVDADECSDMARLHNDTTPNNSTNVCGLLYSVFLSDSPVPKETVFTRAETLYGCDGPGVGHPFAGRYDIISATFECREPHPASDRYKFKVSDPHDSSATTSTTLYDGHM